MKTFLYSWVVYPILYFFAVLIGMTNKKVRDTLRLRSWKSYLSLRYNAGEPIDYWMHVASNGELEYAIPLLKELAIRQRRVLITYYSRSARESIENLPKRYPNVSLVVPLPHDGLGLMKEFVSLMRQQGVSRLLLLKYELWPGLLWECNARGVKVILVNALKPGWFHRHLLHKLSGILFGYNSEVHSLNHPCIDVVGDTRVERVLERISKAKTCLNEAVPASIGERLHGKAVVVCGSMWPTDTKIFLEGLKRLGQDVSSQSIWPQIIWVPHEIERSQEVAAAAAFASMGYTVCGIDHRGPLPDNPLAIIVMKKGILTELYALGKAAFVGGGFGSGVHSVWEPALHGASIACGPRTSRSPESAELAACGLLERVHVAEDVERWLKKILSSTHEKGENERDSKKALGEILERHSGASRRIIDICERI